MSFIKLTKIDSKFSETDFDVVPWFRPYFVQTHAIVGMYEGSDETILHLLPDNILPVKETPEEIVRMIKEEENAK